VSNVLDMGLGLSIQHK